MTDSGTEPPRPPEPIEGAGGVEAALAPLERLGRAPVSEHVAVFEEVLTGLESVLASVDEPGPGAER
jgi:hypothetical protein